MKKETNERSTGDSGVRRGAVLAVVVSLLGVGEVSRAQQTATLLVSNTSYGISGSDLHVTAPDLAVGFTAGRDSGGYALTALDVRFASEPTTELSRVKLSLWTSRETESGRRPNRKLFEFDNPESFKTGDDQINTFTPPGPVYLHDGRRYFLVAESDVGNVIYSLTATDSNSQDQPGSDSGWTIFDGASYWAGSGGPWPEDGVTFRDAGTYVHDPRLRLNRLTTTLPESTADAPHNVGSGNYWAQGFRSTNANEDGYDLHSVAVAFEKFAAQPGVPDDPEDITVSLYTQQRVSGNWVPHRKLFDFHDPQAFREGGDNAFPAPEGTTLKPDEGYLVVIKHESGHTILVRNTYSSDQDGGARHHFAHPRR